jgi:3-methyladenine DNA glycosylase AlkD
MMHTYLKPIQKIFRENANAGNAAGMKAYLLHQFDFFGIKTPERRRFSKAHFKQYPVNSLRELEAIVRDCFEQPEREYQYFGIELFAFHKKYWTKSSIRLMEKCIVTKSWWDSVDTITTEWLGAYFQLFPEEMNKRALHWNQSENTWVQRSSIIFQRRYKKATDVSLLSACILRRAHEEDFFIRKAIGWALREYAKTDAAWVKAFVKQHANILSPLSKREALKNL